MYVRTEMSRYSDQIRVRPRDRTKSISCREKGCSLLQIFEMGSQFRSSSYAMGRWEVIPADINYILRDDKLNFHFHILQRQRINGDTSTLIRTHGLELVMLKYS
jgi:hypothetical protein